MKKVLTYSRSNQSSQKVSDAGLLLSWIHTLTFQQVEITDKFYNSNFVNTVINSGNQIRVYFPYRIHFSEVGTQSVGTTMFRY